MPLGWGVLRVALTYLLVAVVSGGIAYLGNQLGRHIGRRKMSVFGLRPRHTSILITTLTGMLIALTTLTLFALISKPVREILFGIDRLREQEAYLRTQVSQLEERLLQGQIVWRAGEPIIMGVLSPNPSRNVVRDQVTAALASANLESISRNNDLARRDAKQAPIPVDTLLVEYSQAQVNALLDRMAEQPQIMGIQVVASQNCLYRERVPVRIDLLPVKRVFKEGEVVASREVQPDDPQFLVLWYDFLEEMRESAKSKGMIELNSSLRGGMTAADLGRVSQDIARLRGPARLVAVARRDLYETSPLDVRIEVRS